MRRPWLLAAICLAAVATVRADINIDGSTQGSGGAVNPLFHAPLGQSFVADVDDIRWIGFEVGACVCPGDPPDVFQVTLREGAGTSGSVVAVRTAESPDISPDEFLYFDFDGTSLAKGQTYTAELSQISPMQHGGTSVQLSPNVYAGGTAYLHGEATPDRDLKFRALSVVYFAEVEPPVMAARDHLVDAHRRVLPISFTVTANGVPTCDLPPAQLVLRRSLNPFSPVLFSAPLRDTGCRYRFSLPLDEVPILPPSPLGGVPYYQVFVMLSDPDLSGEPLAIGKAIFGYDPGR